MTARKQQFSAIVEKVGINPLVDVPDGVVEALLAAANKSKLPVPVVATVNGTAFTANVVRYTGAARLYLHGVVRKEAKVEVGDRVTVGIDYDPEPRDLPVPPELQAALEESPKAKERWDKLPPSHRKEYLAYLNALKSKESLARNVDKTIAMLIGGKPPYR